MRLGQFWSVTPGQTIHDCVGAPNQIAGVSFQAGKLGGARKLDKDDTELFKDCIPPPDSA